jgi:hypothetical protein
VISSSQGNIFTILNNITVAKSKEVKTGWFESFKENYGSKKAVFPMMKMISKCLWNY